MRNIHGPPLDVRLTGGYVEIFMFSSPPGGSRCKKRGLGSAERFAECRVFRDHPRVCCSTFDSGVIAALYYIVLLPAAVDRAFSRPAAGMQAIISDPAWTSSDVCLLSSTRYEYISWGEAEAS